MDKVFKKDVGEQGKRKICKLLITDWLITIGQQGK